MAFQFQNIPYGWIALAGLIVSGAGIFVINNTEKHIYPATAVQLALGTTERCLATLYATNPVPAYRVNPPTIYSTWVNTNGASETVTNAIGQYVSKAMMDSLDDKIVALVPYYGMSNSPGDNWTVTGLWAHLGIGNKTSLFTSVPCWTNTQTNYPISFTNYYPSTGSPSIVAVTSLYPETVRYAYGFWSNGFYWTNRLFNTPVTSVTTNVATYGDYSQYIYTQCLEERYKVLNALEYFIDQNRTVESNKYFSCAAFCHPIRKYTFSNSVTHVVDYGYSPLVSIRDDLAKSYISYCGYSPYYTNFYIPNWFNIKNELVPELTWVQMHGAAETIFFPINSTNTFNDNVNFFYQAYKYPATLGSDVRYEWRISFKKSAAKFKWANFQHTNIASTFGVYYSGATNVVGITDTQIETNSTSWTLPQIHNRTYLCEYEEGLTESSLYQKIDDAFITTEGENNVLNLGWGDIDLPGSVPPPAVCDEPTGGASYSDNTGSAGTLKGMSIPMANFKGVRKFQFSYCTNRYW